MPDQKIEADELKTRLAELGEGWTVEENHHLRKEFTFPDFVTALDFANAIATIAEDQQHHPDILLAWGRVGISVWTHTLNGLSEKDFRLARSINEIPVRS